MPSFCLYGMCHNLGSSTYQGYCNEYHMKRAWEREMKEKLAKLQESLSTIQTAKKDVIPLTSSSQKRSDAEEDVIPLTSSSRCEECTKSPHG